MLILTGYTYKVSIQPHGKSHFGEADVNVDITTAFKAQITDALSELKLVRIRSMCEWVY
jgi:hypothetical protein